MFLRQVLQTTEERYRNLSDHSSPTTQVSVPTSEGKREVIVEDECIQQRLGCGIVLGDIEKMIIMHKIIMIIMIIMIIIDSNVDTAMSIQCPK